MLAQTPKETLDRRGRGLEKVTLPGLNRPINLPVLHAPPACIPLVSLTNYRHLVTLARVGVVIPSRPEFA